MATLDTPLVAVVGGKAATVAREALGLETVGQLLAHYPRRYVHRGELTGLGALPVGEYVTVFAQVKKVTVRAMRSRPGSILDVVISDGDHTLHLTFFSQSWRKKELYEGWRGLFAGKVTMYRGERQLTHPDYGPAEQEEAPAGEGGPSRGGTSRPGAGGSAAARGTGAGSGKAPGQPARRRTVRAIVPVYPATAAITSWVLANLVELALASLDPPEDPLPAEVRSAHGLISLGEALRCIHLPDTDGDISQARRRLAWDEALVLQTVLAQRRDALAGTPATPRPPRQDGLLAAFDRQLPFTLTEGQQRVSVQIFADMNGSSPMQRLLQGEVGSGKTVVALRAMLAAVDAGGQAVLLAPTEVLAVQHLHSLRTLLGPLGRAGQLDGAERATAVELLTGATPPGRAREIRAALARGSVGIVVGTHALLEEDVRFRDLALVVVDEQHRFGVEQRDALRNRGDVAAHVLVMTATPIPRTVAMTVFGDLETSVLAEVPPGRGAVSTYVVPRAAPGWLDRMWARVREEAAAGRQAFVVCPRIGDAASDDDDAADGAVDDGDPAGSEADRGLDPGAQRGQAVLDVAMALQAGPLSGLRLGTLHGRLSSDVKDSVMGAFARGELDVLVATTVVEVGVDVPNATAMVVLDADRFGISQLHQLRGRVGRGGAPAVCLLETAAPSASPARARVEAVAATTDGFELARLDLQARREGDVLGAAQSGQPTRLRLLSLERDEELIAAARQYATAVVAVDPELRRHSALRSAVAATVAPEAAAFLDKV